MNFRLYIFSFLLVAFFLASCKSTTSPENQTNQFPATMDIYINGDHTHLQEGVEGRQVYNYMRWGDRTGTQYYEKIGLGKLPAGGYLPKDYIPPALTISFLSDWRNSTPPGTDLLYWVGPYDFARSIDSGTGVMINWIDANGKIWDSNFGSGDQTGSQFFITKFLSGDFHFAGSPNYNQRTEGYFSCTLYDGLGASLRIDSVRFSFINGWRTN